MIILVGFTVTFLWWRFKMICYFEYQAIKQLLHLCEHPKISRFRIIRKINASAAFALYQDYGLTIQEMKESER